MTQVVADLDSQRFRQEAPYTTALVSKLEAVRIETEEGTLSIRSTVYDDRGTGAAEAQFGADFAITAEISDPAMRVSKAILFQAKLGRISELSAGENERLARQVQKMRSLTRSPKILEIPEVEPGLRSPHVVSGNRYLGGAAYTSVSLPDYVVRRVLTTLDGDTRPEFIEQVEDSTLKAFRVDVSLNRVSSRPFG